MSNPIYSITPFTLLDYPDRTACILWFAGCNMRCVYCYNPEIVLGKGKISTSQILQFLSKRKGLLDGVVFSGGECTLHKGIFNLAECVKSLNMLVKIDTNGSKPEVINQLIKEKLVDYIALDFKALPDRFMQITDTTLFSEFERSLQLLLESKIDFEIRTTVHSELISEEDIFNMAEYLYEKGYRNKPYYIQHFLNGVKTIGNPGYSSTHKYFQNEIQPFDFPRLIYR